MKDEDLDIDMGEEMSIVEGRELDKSELLRCMNGLEAYQGSSIKIGGRQDS
ncbi:MAG TPA: amino acid ABC transporter ATP-binding protein, partial [Erwinia persicina]|nr:amino acid ABC transporter ATP-binding protein [Erwinia persicina]